MSEKRLALLELIDKIEQLGQFQDRIDSPSTISQIWQVFLADIRNLIDVEVCALFLVDEDSKEFVLKQASPKNRATMCKQEVESQIECGTFSWVINRRQPALIPILAFEKVKSVVMMPLSTIKQTLGVVLVITPVKESLITQEHIKLLSILSKQCAIVMENTLLYERLQKKHRSLEKANKEIKLLSRSDPLTGCFNRGYLNEQFPREIKRALRYEHSLSIALCDIDHFKKVNDTYGHLCGDRVLQEFVGSISEVIRSDTDWIARYGGEEFLIVLPETKLEGAHLLAERLRNYICQKTIAVDGEKINITASFGVSAMDADKLPRDMKPEAMIRAADKYVYMAKKQGRNKVVSGPVAED
jgi:diguanylate cyclase (GGDEF)-like protein